jgi:error-prone DNA polymerase
VLGPDLNRSAWRPTIEADGQGRALRLGFWFVRGLQGNEVGPRLVAERDRHGPYRDLTDLCRRACDFLTPTTIEALILAGACDGWGERRRQLLWRLPTTWRAAVGLPLPVETPTLPPASVGEVLSGEAWAAAMLLNMHPAALVRPALDAAGVLSLRELAGAPTGATIVVAGRPLLVRRPPTGKGTCFVSVDDETGLGQLVLDEATDRRDRALLHAPLIVAEGVVQRRRGVQCLRVIAVQPQIPK